jgi:2-oxoglutarate ferredoxin oxidoreductase subunit beta
VTSTSPGGNPDAPLNGLALALAAGATFLARGFAAQPKALVELITAAIAHRGFSIVEVMSPCVTYNKTNTYAWFKDNVYDLAARNDYAPSDRGAAFEALTRDGSIPLGVIYRDERAPFEERCGLPADPIAKLDLRVCARDYARLADGYR